MKKVTMATMVVAISVISICGLMLSSCSPDKEVERLQVQLDIMNPDLEIQFPGEFSVEDQCFILFDPLSKSEFVRVLDKQTGEKIIGFLDIGQGPNEFSMPMYGYSANDTMTVFDLNFKKKIECSLNSLSEGKAAIHPIRFPFNDVGKLARVNANQYIGGIFRDQTPFVFIKGDDIVLEFGKYPIEETVTNSVDKLQGTILYNKNRQILGYAAFQTPYISLYQFEKDTFRLLWESRFSKAHYYISDQQLRWEDNQPAGISSFAFAKDYIFCLVSEMRLKERVGRSKEIMPKTVYVYNYKGELLKILELDIPSTRISASTNSNVIYFISIDEEYALTKLDVQKYNL
jgi:hypothetical protein